MSWPARTWIAGEIVTAALGNSYWRDPLSDLRGGGLAISGQQFGDFIVASSATQLARVAASGAGGGKSPYFISPTWSMVNYYPIGSVYINASDATNPATLMGFGTWVAFGSGRVLVGVDGAQTEFDTLGETGGAKTHTLTTGEVPALTVGLSGVGGSSNTIAAAKGGAQADSVTTTNGSGGAHNNLQPYITVYFWKRTA